MITFISPIAAYHHNQAARISQVVAAQTVPCQHIIIHDDEGRGAGWARNQGLAQVNTRFVVFLDADDDIAPTFAEKTLRAFLKYRRYIYTDWLADGKRVNAPECAWTNATWHVVTTLMPTAWALAVGGFDETMPVSEDSDFYLKLVTGGYCGKRLPEALFTYGGGGKRSKRMLVSGFKNEIMARLTRRYEGKMTDCTTCGGNPGIPNEPLNAQMEGAVLVKAVWAGNRRERGTMTGELYPRGGNGSLMYVYEEDATASPHLFQRVEEEQDYDDVRDIAAWLMGEERAPDGKTYAAPLEAVAANVEVKADVQKVLAKAQRSTSRSTTKRRR